MHMHRSARTAEPWHLVRKVFLLLLLVVAVALGLTLLLDHSDPAPMLMFNLMADCSIGTAMGLGSRWVVQRRHWLIRAVVSASLSIIGLVLLAYLTNATSGVGPLTIKLQRVNWLDGAGIPLRVPVLPGNSPTDLLDVAHSVIAVDLSWIALRAWRGASRIVPAQNLVVRSGRGPVVNPAAVRVPSVTPAAVSATHSMTRGPSRPRGRQRWIGRCPAQTAIAIRPQRAGGQRRSLFRRHLAVQIAAYEEYRCPYCLEDVKRGDIRGSVECPICHTLHHKDCWDITGTCQVPHLNG